VKAPLSEVNLLERSATYLARESARRSSPSKISMANFLVSGMDAMKCEWDREEDARSGWKEENANHRVLDRC